MENYFVFFISPRPQGVMINKMKQFSTFHFQFFISKRLIDLYQWGIKYYEPPWNIWNVFSIAFEIKP